MSTCEIKTNSCILEFKEWLIFNRSVVTAFLRKTNVIKKYFATISIGISIFIINDFINDKGINSLGLFTFSFLILLNLTSHRISYFFSGGKYLMTIPVVELELKSKWLKNIRDCSDFKDILLDDYYVVKAVELSKRNRFDLFYFLKAMVLISDSIVFEEI